MELQNAITVIQTQNNDILYERIIDYLNSSKETDKAHTVGGYQPDIRNVSVKQIRACDTSKTEKILTKLIDHEISKYFYLHKAKFSHLALQRITDIQALKYEVGGKYEIHTDSLFQFKRELTCIVNLNDDYEGGEFDFYHPNGKEVIKTVETKKGQMIFFPSNHMFPHAVKPITKGTRYSIVVWLA